MLLVKATLLVRDRIAYADEVFSEIVVWQVPQPLLGSSHGTSTAWPSLSIESASCDTTMRPERAIIGIPRKTRLDTASPHWTGWSRTSNAT